MRKSKVCKTRVFLPVRMVFLMILMCVMALPGYRGAAFAAENETVSVQPAAGVNGTDQTAAVTGTVPADGKSEITVEPSLSASKLIITSSQKKKLILQDCKEKPVWKSSNKKVALIKKTADPCKVWIKGQKAGKATITVKVGSKKYSCKITVKYQPKLSLTKKTLKGDETVTLKVSGTIDQAVWSSSDPDIARVSRSKGKTVKVKGVRNGKATIYAKVNRKTLSCAIRVKGITPTVNCIMGSKNSGYYYVDGSGTQVYDSEIVTALNFLNSVSSDNQTPRDRLLACFRRLCTYTYSWHPDSPSASVMPRYAADTFRTRVSNCWRFGAAFAYIARVLGYDSRVCIGGVTAYQNHALDNHGWCEIYIGGTWKMVDVSMQMHHPEVNLFLVPRNEYPFRLRCDNVYTLRVTNGQVYWG